MASPNSNYHQFHAFADLALAKMKSPDQILGQNSGTNVSRPTETTISTRVPEKDQKTMSKMKQPVLHEEEGDQPIPQRFTFSLTKDEIEKDMFAMTGKRPLRCKKKRTKKMMNELEVLTPGSSLDGYAPEALGKSYGPFSSKHY